MKNLYIVLVLLLITFVGCSSNKKEDTLIVGVSADAPPFEFIDSKGEFDGFDIELVRRIAQKLDMKVKFVHIDFNNLLSALQGGRIDLAISSITATQERKNMFDFTRPYLFDGIVAVYKKGSDYTSFSDIKDAIIGVQRGTMLESWIRLISLSSIKSISMNTVAELIQALDNNKINLMLLDKLEAQILVKENRNLGYFDVGSSPDGYAIAMKKGSPYQLKLDTAIHQLEADGTIKMLIRKWLVAE